MELKFNRTPNKNKGYIVKVNPVENETVTSVGTLSTIIDAVEISLSVVPFTGAKLVFKILNPKGKTLKYQEIDLPEQVYESWGEDDAHIENFVLNMLNLTKYEEPQ